MKWLVKPAMFPSKLVCPLAVTLWAIIGVQAGCQFWSGTAPFCDGGCGDCRTLATSNCGNRGCWTGRKALCQCCPGSPPCMPQLRRTSPAMGLHNAHWPGNVTLSEDEIEQRLVKEFGVFWLSKLTTEQIKDVKIVKVIQLDLSIKGEGNTFKPKN